MNSVAKLIKSKVIPFVENFIKHYQEIGLKEEDAMIICKLFYLSEEGNKVLNINALEEQVTLSIDELSNHVMNLVDKGYIELVCENGKEEFNLNGTIEKLANVLDVDKKEMENSQVVQLINMSISYVETTFGRTCSTADLILIKQWVADKFSYEQIKEAVLETAKCKKDSLRYANAILRSHQERKKVDDDEVDLELKEMLSNLMNK